MKKKIAFGLSAMLLTMSLFVGGCVQVTKTGNTTQPSKATQHSQAIQPTQPTTDVGSGNTQVTPAPAPAPQSNGGLDGYWISDDMVFEYVENSYGMMGAFTMMSSSSASADSTHIYDSDGNPVFEYVVNGDTLTLSSDGSSLNFTRTDKVTYDAKMESLTEDMFSGAGDGNGEGGFSFSTGGDGSEDSSSGVIEGVDSDTDLLGKWRSDDGVYEFVFKDAGVIDYTKSVMNGTAVNSSGYTSFFTAQDGKLEISMGDVYNYSFELGGNQLTLVNTVSNETIVLNKVQ